MAEPTTPQDAREATLPAKEQVLETDLPKLAPSEEFARRLEHFAQKAHVLAGLTSSGKIRSFDAFQHLQSLWERLSEEGGKLTEPAAEEKSALVGLTSADAAQRLRRYGPNQAVAEKKIGFGERLFMAVKNPLVLLLLVLGVISYLTDDISSAAIIISMALMGVTLKVVQESKADTAAAQLKQMVHTTATALRDGVKREIPLAKIVPGDVVLLAAGDMVPADIQLLKSKDLHINQAMLTGEALPVEKQAPTEAAASPREKALDDPSMCFMGTNVISGTAMALVVSTGTATYLGGISAKLSEKRAPTDFDKGIKKFTTLMLRFMMFMVPFVFFANGVFKGSWSEAFMFALAVAVGLTPEMLPMVVTVCLSKGALAMSRRKVIVKRLEAIQNFGAIDILCTDKTGTLTQDKIILEKPGIRQRQQPFPDRPKRRHRRRGHRKRDPEPGAHRHREIPQARRNSLRFHAPAHECRGRRQKIGQKPADLQGRGRGSLQVQHPQPGTRQLLPARRGAPGNHGTRGARFERGRFPGGGPGL